jgi:transposase
MMAEKRRQYTEEFKQEAIRLVTEQGDGIAETARNLGSKAHRLGRGKRECARKGSAAFPGNGRMSADQEELRRVRDDNTRLRMERDSLTKALGFCASGSN